MQSINVISEIKKEHELWDWVNGMGWYRLGPIFTGSYQPRGKMLGPWTEGRNVIDGVSAGVCGTWGARQWGLAWKRSRVGWELSKEPLGCSKSCQQEGKFRRVNIQKEKRGGEWQRILRDISGIWLVVGKEAHEEDSGGKQSSIYLLSILPRALAYSVPSPPAPTGLLPVLALFSGRLSLPLLVLCLPDPV